MSKIPLFLEKQVRESSKNRCGYCLVPQDLTSYKLEIEYIYPTAKGGNSEKGNLCLACRHCNLHKSSKIYGLDLISGKKARIFNPNKQKWTRHFIWNEDKILMIGKTICGRATIYALKMNDELQTIPRAFWKLTDIFPPAD